MPDSLLGERHSKRARGTSLGQQTKSQLLVARTYCSSPVFVIYTLVLSHAVSIREQLKKLLQRFKVKMISCGGEYKLLFLLGFTQHFLCTVNIDGFQMSIMRPTSGGQTRNQEAAVQWTFHLERSSFFYLSVLMVRTQCSTY